MKNFLLATSLAIFSVGAFATVDGHDRAYIIVQDIQDGEFFVERVPIIGCWGLMQGPQLSQWTRPYVVKSSIGCGETDQSENINALTCATVEAAEENASFTGFSKITLNISQCAAKNNPQFLKMIRATAKRNFPQAKGEVQLTLIK